MLEPLIDSLVVPLNLEPVPSSPTFSLVHIHYDPLHRIAKWCYSRIEKYSLGKRSGSSYRIISSAVLFTVQCLVDELVYSCNQTR